MLIESTRDSLCFTVTHYKHSKQQYSIQVRSRLGRSSWGRTCCLCLLNPVLRLGVSPWKVGVIVGTSQACADESR